MHNSRTSETCVMYARYNNHIHKERVIHEYMCRIKARTQFLATYSTGFGLGDKCLA